MGETAEKIYCCDHDNNDNAPAAAIPANGNNRRDDWGPMAAMMGGGMNNWMNNPFAYLMFLALFRNGGFGKIEGSIGEMKELMKKQQEMMVNANGQQHSWTASQVKKSMESLGLSIPGKVTTGDVTYAANMAYADFYPDPLKDEAACLRYAHKVANDPDGYDGMIFCRWTADAIGKAIKLDWEKFV